MCVCVCDRETHSLLEKSMRFMIWSLFIIYIFILFLSPPLSLSNTHLMINQRPHIGMKKEINNQSQNKRNEIPRILLSHAVRIDQYSNWIFQWLSQPQIPFLSLHLSHVQYFSQTNLCRGIRRKMEIEKQKEMVTMVPVYGW